MALRRPDGIICTLGDPLTSEVLGGGPWRTRILANFGAGTDDIHQTYTTNQSTGPANGTWKHRVQDAAGADI